MLRRFGNLVLDRNGGGAGQDSPAPLDQFFDAFGKMVNWTSSTVKDITVGIDFVYLLVLFLL